MSACKSCKTAATMEWRKNNATKWNIYVKDYSKTEKAAARIAEYRKTERAKELARAADAKRNEQKKQWRELNREVCQLYSRNKHAKRRAAIDATVEKITAEQWRGIVSQYKGLCYYCGKKAKMTIEHLVPLSKGGDHSVANIVPACLSCNCKKHANDNYTFAKRFGKLF